MDQEDSKRAKHEQMEKLRQKLNEEIEKEDFNLCAQSVMEISVKLDHYIVDHYQKN